MPRQLRCYIRGSLVDVCFRAEEGLPLVPTPAMRYLLKGIIGRALELYPVTISDIVVMGNHIHMLLLVEDPGAVPLFLQYVKRESAHAINQILGRTKRTVWCHGSDNPVVLDPETAVKRLTYIYLNPARANLEQSIDLYPHLHSWEAFCNETVQEDSVYQIPRDSVALFYRLAEKRSLKRAVRAIRKHAACRKATYRVQPFAWTRCFAETRDKDLASLKKEVIAAVRQEERRLSTVITRRVIGAKQLMVQRMDVAYTPSKRGKKMVCRGATRDIRSRYLQWYDASRTLAKKAIQRLKEGIVSLVPPGFFYPGGYLLSNVLPAASPIGLG